MNITRRPPQGLALQGRTRGYSYQREYNNGECAFFGWRWGIGTHRGAGNGFIRRVTRTVVLPGPCMVRSCMTPKRHPTPTKLHSLPFKVHSMSVVTTAGTTGRRAGGAGGKGRAAASPSAHKVSTRPRRAASWLGLGLGLGLKTANKVRSAVGLAG